MVTYSHPLKFCWRKMVDPSGQLTSASYTDTNKLANTLLRTLADQEASIGYGMLACALTICRLLNTGDMLEDEDEIGFIEALMEWSGAYFVTDKGKGN